MLWLLCEGEAHLEARAHLSSCVACQARYQRLERDVRLVRATLAHPPAWPAAPHRRAALLPWLAAAAAVAMLIAWWGWQLSPPAGLLAPAEPAASAWAFLEEVSSVLFASGADALPELADFQAVIDAAWWCEADALFGDVTCREPAFLLLAGGR
jgi:hypothetical protein